MRISIIVMDDLHTTRHSSMILCYLDFIFLKAIPVLKEMLNNIGKQAECFPHLQLVSNDVFISSVQMKKHHFRRLRQNYAKTWFNQPARKVNKIVHWTSNETACLIVHEQIAKVQHEDQHRQRFF